MTPSPRRRRRAAGSSSWDQTPSRRKDPWPEPGSGSQREIVGARTSSSNKPGSGHTPGGRLPATHVARAAARWSDPVARGRMTETSEHPIAEPRSIAVTAIWADSGGLLRSATRSKRDGLLDLR